METALLMHHAVDDFAHAQATVILNALGSADYQRLGRKMRRNLLKQPAAVVRRHHADHGLGSAQNFSEVIGSSYRVGNVNPIEEGMVRVLGVDGGTYFRLVGPEPHALVAVAANHDGQRRSPRSGPDYRDIVHACFSSGGAGGSLGLPNLCSVPFSRRR